MTQMTQMTHDTGSKASSEALDSGFRESSSLRHSEQRALPCSGNMWKHLPLRDPIAHMEHALSSP